MVRIITHSAHRRTTLNTRGDGRREKEEKTVRERQRAKRKRESARASEREREKVRTRARASEREGNREMERDADRKNAGEKHALFQENTRQGTASHVHTIPGHGFSCAQAHTHTNALFQCTLSSTRGEG